jgi:hypothetical protein
MSKMRARAQAQFPTVLLTLISIIQALALELMWGKITESDFLWTLTMPALIAWGMISVSLMGILQIWLSYSTLVMGFTWRPMFRDSIVPFVVGIQEFMMVSLISDEFNVFWLYVLASVFIVVNWVIHNSLQRAREDSANDAFFKNRATATFKDFTGAISIIAALVLFGIAFDILAESDWVALAAIVFANIALAVQIISSRNLWRILMSLPD